MVLIALGLTVIAGWLLRIPVLTQVLPGFTSMVLNTALSFTLCGIALLNRQAGKPVLRGTSVVAALVVLGLALLNGWQLYSGMQLGINLPQLHTWIGDNNAHPGQMSEPTTVCFTLASLALLLLGLRRRPLRAAVGLSLSLLVALIGVVALIGYALHIEALYHWYLFSRMALHTAVGMCALGSALWLSWREPTRRLDDARGIVALAAASLAVVAILSGLIAAAWFRGESDAALSRTQEALRGSRAIELAVTLKGRSERSAIVTTQPQLREQLRRLTGHPGDLDALRLARADVDSLMPNGFSRIELRSGHDELLVAMGEALPAGLAEFPLRVPVPGLASLVWNDGFVLRHRHELIEDGERLGTITTEQPIPDLMALFESVVAPGEGDRILICGEPRGGPALACLPPSHQGQLVLPPGAFAGFLSAAESGESGHRNLHDEQGHGLQFSYGPVGQTGLVLALAVPDAALYAPVRSALSYGVLLIALVSFVAVTVLHARVQPLAERLETAEGRYALVARALHEGLLLLDEDGRVLATNEVGASQFGFTAEQLTGQRMTGRWPIYRDDGALMTPADYPGATALATNRPVTNRVIRMQRPDGRWCWIRVSAVPTEERGGRRYAVVTFTDITVEREAAERERVSERRFRQIIDNVEDYAIFLLDPDGRIATWSPGAEKIKGCSEAEAIGQHFSIFYLEEDRQAGLPEKLLSAARVTGHSSTEGWRQRRNGERFWASVVISAVYDEHEVLSGYAKVTRDLTERRRAEEALRQSEESYRGLVDGVVDGVVSVDAHGIVQSLNRAAEKMFGRQAADVIGRNVTMLIPERYRAGHDNHVARFAGGQEPRLIGLRREVVGLHSDGHEIPMMLALSVAPGTNQNRYVALVSDLTERQRHERALAEINRRMRSLVDSAPFAIIASDAKGIIDCFNPAAERLTFYKREEMIGHVVQPIHLREEVEARAQELSEQLGETIEPGFDVFTALPKRGITDLREWTYVRKDGSRVPVQLALSELRDPEDGRVTGYIGVAYDISERKRREEYTRHVARHDFLTGLPNRLLFNDRLSSAFLRAQRHNEKLALMLLDLDHFKHVNDSLGHHVGDELLKVVALRLHDCVRAADTVARLGGDEFVVLLEELKDSCDAERVAEKIVAALAEPVFVGDRRLQVSTSVGLAFYPDDAADAVHLLRNADCAMYRAKAGGRGRYVAFNAEIGRQAHARLAMEQALRRALREDRFRLHYQPQIDCCDGRVVGVEALLRWTDPELGEVTPDTFIPVAEDSGLIVPIGEWVLRTACREIVEIQRQLGASLRLAVNLSPRQFRQDSLIATLRSALDGSGLSPTQLEVEITEGMLMADTDDSTERLRALRALGVKIAIDDFGVGFSSLAYLTRFHIDTLKIDRQFIRNLSSTTNDAAVVEAIVALAVSLGVQVIAEGVESGEQLGFLRHHGSVLVKRGDLQAQGFYFGAAVSAETFIAGYADCVARSRSRLLMAA